MYKEQMAGRYMNRLYKATACIGVFLWLILGLIIIGSISLGTTALTITITIGSIFVFMDLYLCLKAKYVVSILKEINKMNLNNHHSNLFQKTNKFILAEIIFNFLSILVAVLLLMGVIHRIWQEGMSVFG